MTPEIKNLLSVLDMAEWEQERWVWDNIPRGIRESLADLAFREMKEAIELSIHRWYKAKLYVANHRLRNIGQWDEWLRPIDIIIAAEIAKAGSK